MQYKYSTPEEAIISLEQAYTNKDLENILSSKDFISEAKLILEQKSYEFTNEIISEVAELLRLSLIKNLEDNGYPNFGSARHEFSETEWLKDNIFILEEKIFYPDNTFYINKVFVSKNSNIWKVAMIEE